MNKRTIVIATSVLTAIWLGVGCTSLRKPASPVERNRVLKADLARTRQDLADAREENRERVREQQNLEKCLLQMESVAAAIRDPEHHQVIVPPLEEIEVLDVILEEPLDGTLPEACNVDREQGTIVAMPDGRNALWIAVDPDETKKDRRVGFRLPVGELAGSKLRCTIQAKGENISKPPVHWAGGKFQLWVKTPEKSYWPDAGIGGGTFDWKTLTFFYDVPFDATGIVLFIGLESVSGTICFRDLKVEVVE